MEKKYNEIIGLIEANNSFLVCSHAHPDGDGIASTLAIGMALKSFGKDVILYNQDGVPRVLSFLPSADLVVNSVDANAKFDVSILVDCSQPDRAGRHFPSKENRGLLVCIDHHVTGGEEADIACLDEGAASTGEVVYNILKGLKFTITPEIATMILTTLIVDTGFFRYSNTTPHSLSLASELVGMGASTWEISKSIEERNEPEQLNLLATTLRTMEYFLDGKLVVMVLTRQMLIQNKADIEMAEEFINFPRSIRGVEVAVLIREKTSREYKISFRSKGSVNVAALAIRFSGGGHEHAAGCTLYGKLGTVKQTVIDAVEKVLCKGSGGVD